MFSELAKESKVLVMKGCGTCDILKANGLCKEEKCVDVSTTQGIKLVRETKTTATPQRICKTKSGKFTKCNTNSIIKKFSRKKK